MKVTYVGGLFFMLYVCAACSDDRNNPDYAGKIAGTYQGYSAASFAYSSVPVFTTDQTVTVTKETEETVNLSYTDAGWGTYRLEGARVNPSDGKYTFSGNGKVALSMGSAPLQEYDYTLTAVADGEELTFSVSIPAVMGGVRLDFRSGEAPAGVRIAGAYVGKTSVAFQYSPNPVVSENDTLNLEANLDGTADFSYVNGSFGEFSVKGMEVSLSGGVYSFSGQDSVAMGMSGSSPRKYFFTLEGNVDAATRKASFVAKVPAVMGGITVTYTDGVKQVKN